MRVLVFAGDWACEIELRQTVVICFPWRQRSWSCGVFKSWVSVAHCPFQWKWQVLHNYDISVFQQVGMFFDGIAYLMKVWPLFKREVPRVPMTWRCPRARANFKCDVANVNNYKSRQCIESYFAFYKGWLLWCLYPSWCQQRNNYFPVNIFKEKVNRSCDAVIVQKRANSPSHV